MSWSYYLRIISSTSWAYSSSKITPLSVKFVSTVLYHRSSAILDFYGGFRWQLVPRLPFPAPRSPLPAPRSPLPVPRFSNILITRQKLNTHFYWSISHPPFAHLSTPTKSWRGKIQANWANQFSCVDKNAPCLFIHNNSSKHDCFSAGCVCANFCNFEPFSFPELRSFWSAEGIDNDFEPEVSAPFLSVEKFL